MLVVGLVWYFNTKQTGFYSQVPAPTLTPEVGTQSDTQLKTEVENIDLGNLDPEFQAIDSDISSL